MTQLSIAPLKTAMEVFRALPEGTRAEVIDNVIYMAPSPFERHQRVSGDLSGEIYIYSKKHRNIRFYSAPFDVYLDDAQNAVQPDIIILMDNNSAVSHPDGHLHGVPDIIIEILSKSNQDHDLIRKKDLYERFGVKEYFIIEPETGLTYHYYLQDRKYVLVKQDIRKMESKLLLHTFEWQ